jgi:ParB family transcriptional regulator, chromosome partitioning protein
MELKIADIQIGVTRRLLRDIKPLTESIAALGLLQPIVVTEDNQLVAGYHRLEACRALGWETIPVSVVQYDELDRELAEIDENLIRYELSQLERSALLYRRKRIYEQRHPEVKSGANPGKAGGGKETKSAVTASFVADTAAKTGRAKRTISEDVQIGRDIPENLQEVLKDTPLADRRGDLIELSRVTRKEPEIADRILEEVHQGKNVQEAVSAYQNAARRPLHLCMGMKCRTSRAPVSHPRAQRRGTAQSP